MKIVSHVWLEICFSFKTMKNIKIADPVLTMNIFMTKIIINKKVLDTTKKKRFAGNSLQPPWVANRK